MILLRLLSGRLLAASLVAHLGGLGLLALVVLVEGRDLAEALARAPRLWVAAVAPLALVAGALAAARARRQGVVLALGCLGIPATTWIAAAFVAGALAGAGAALLPPEALAPALPWVRGEGGWYFEGLPVPDLPGGNVSPVPPPRPPVWAPPALAAGAAALGAATGLRSGVLGTLVATGSIIVADALVRGLVDRGALPGASLAALAAALLAGALWVGRSRRCSTTLGILA